MDRRSFLLVLGAGLTAVAAARGSYGPLLPGDAPRAAPARGAPEPRREAGPAPVRPAGSPPLRTPPTGVVSGLPGEGRLLALTIDDGTGTGVVAAFAELAAVTGIRLTFFPNGRYASWTDNAAALRPLVASGQVALGNHTWSHADLTTLPDADVAADIRRNRRFLDDVFDAGSTPFFRPPFGARTARTDRIAADLGHPTVAMWNGTLEDARPVSADDLVQAGRRWFRRQALVVGHANRPTVVGVLDELVGLVERRRLTTVTLADVWARPSPS